MRFSTLFCLKKTVPGPHMNIEQAKTASQNISCVRVVVDYADMTITTGGHQR